jgi:hypothetical protein
MRVYSINSIISHDVNLEFLFFFDYALFVYCYQNNSIKVKRMRHTYRVSKTRHKEEATRMLPTVSLNVSHSTLKFHLKDTRIPI